MNRKDGIVAFVDILGYTSLMENCDIGENTEKILQLINSLPKTQKELQLSSFKKSDNDIHNIIESIQILIVSDSILFTMPFSKNEKSNTRAIDWAIALLYLNRLFRTFMDNGLPLRGSISCGEFMTIENCFAGKPIILAYKDGQELNCAGIRLDINALRDIVSCVVDNKDLGSLFAINELEHKNKKGELEKDYFVSLFLNYSSEERILLSDERELTIYLTTSFAAHNKTINGGGKVKLNNTIDLYRQAFNYKEK